MSTLLLERPPTLEEGFEHGARRRLGGAPDTGQVDAHGRLTLDDLIVGVWEGLAVRATVRCPVCAGSMASSPHEHAEDTLVGACTNCGARLA
jgi:DnaJ-class molecular chaperone